MSGASQGALGVSQGVVRASQGSLGVSQGVVRRSQGALGVSQGARQGVTRSQGRHKGLSGRHKGRQGVTRVSACQGVKKDQRTGQIERRTGRRSQGSTKTPRIIISHIFDFMFSYFYMMFSCLYIYIH